MIHYTCSTCGQALRIPDEYAGKKGSCKKCGMTFRVPRPAADKPKPPVESGVAPVSKRQTAATASLVLGLLSLGTLAFTGLPAVICGHAALGHIGKSPPLLLGRWKALTGIFLGYISIAVTLGIGVHWALARVPATAAGTGMHDTGGDPADTGQETGSGNRSEPLLPAAPGVDFAGKCVDVIDGDTIQVMHDGRRQTLRLHGIDCPEAGQPFAAAATEFTGGMVFGREVHVDTTGRDGTRTTAFVYTPDGRSLNAALVAMGLAWYYDEHDPAEPELKRLESAARAEARGLWAHPRIVPPWEYREKEGGRGSRLFDLD